MCTESQYEKQMNNNTDRDYAIELLAEQLSSASVSVVGQVCMASNYEFSYKLMMNETNGSDKFNDMFYEIATKLIDSVG